MLIKSGHMEGKVFSAIMTLVLLAGTASGTWNSFRGDDENTGSSMASFESTKDLKIEWEFKGDGPVRGAVVGIEDLLAFSTMNGSVYILNGDGEMSYKRQVKGKIFNSPMIDPENDTMLVATSDGEVLSYSLYEGIKKWNTTVGDGSSIHSCPKQKEDTVIITSYDSNIYCLDPATGEERWNFTGCGGQVHTTPAFFEDDDRDLVLFGSCDGKLYALHRSNGTEAWSFQAEYIPSSPAVYEDRVYFGSFDDNLYCLTANSGEVVWNTSLGSSIFSSPAVSEQYVCAASDDGLVHLLNAETGEIIWSERLTDSSLETSPLICPDLIAVTYDSGLGILSLEDGSVLRGFEVGDSSETSPSIVDNMILFGDSAGYARAISEIEDNGEEPLDMGEEDDPERDIVVIIVGIIVLIGFAVVLYLGYLRIRRNQ
jgi:outer membrane protein assembly factor BamB